MIWFKDLDVKYKEYCRKDSHFSPKIFSFFSGAGFLDLGFEAAGFEVFFVNESHKPFVDAYKFSRKMLGIEEPKGGFYIGDIQDLLVLENLPFENALKKCAKSSELIGFIGGPPCPDFSVGGKNKGQFGENGKLSKSYIELIIKCSPDFFLFENVKGLYKTRKHREFYETLKGLLAGAGYILHEKLINSISYGAPQDRERIILFGHKPNIGIANFDWNRNVLFPEKEAFEFCWPNSDSKETKVGIEPPSILTVKHWFDRNEVEYHPNSIHYFQPRAGLTKFMSIREGDVARKSYKRLHRNKYSPTAAYGNNEVHIHPTLERRISVSEALAIQSLPSDFILPENMTLTNMFKTIGNGVPFLAALGIATNIYDHLNEAKAWKNDLPLAI